MNRILGRRSFFLLLLLASLSLQFLPGLCNDSKDGEKAENHSTKPGGTGSIAIILLFVLLAFGLFTFFLFKLWQKKKREEQYARLLKLFEEDDELELELGLRD